jgi:hypothetical protein
VPAGARRAHELGLAEPSEVIRDLRAGRRDGFAELGGGRRSVRFEMGDHAQSDGVGELLKHRQSSVERTIHGRPAS